MHTYAVQDIDCHHQKRQNLQAGTCKSASCHISLNLVIFYNVVIPLTHHKNSGYTELKVFGVYPFVHRIFIAIRLKIQTKSSHKNHKS